MDMPIIWFDGDIFMMRIGKQRYRLRHFENALLIARTKGFDEVRLSKGVSKMLGLSTIFNTISSYPPTPSAEAED